MEKMIDAKHSEAGPEAPESFEGKLLKAQIEAAEGAVDEQGFLEGAKRHCRDKILAYRAAREEEALELMPKLHALRRGQDDIRTVEQVLDDISEERARLQTLAKWHPFQTAKMIGCAAIGVLGLMTEIPMIGPVIINPMRGSDETMAFLDWCLATLIIVSLIAIFAVALHKLVDLLDDRLRRIVKLALGLTALWLLAQAPYLSEGPNKLAEALGRAEAIATQGSTFFRSMAALMTGAVAALMFDSAWRGYREQHVCRQAATEAQELGELHAKGKRMIREHGSEAETAVQLANDALRQGYRLMQGFFEQRAASNATALGDTLNLAPSPSPMRFPEKVDAPEWVEKLAHSAMPPAIDYRHIRREHLSHDVLERLSEHTLHLVKRADEMRTRAITISTRSTKEVQNHAV